MSSNTTQSDEITKAGGGYRRFCQDNNGAKPTQGRIVEVWPTLEKGEHPRLKLDKSQTFFGGVGVA